VSIGFVVGLRNFECHMRYPQSLRLERHH
jgi:hypothetical protein